MIKRLEEMDLPNDIKNMDTDELELLAVAIRDFLISNISETGGHLASNLGVVELTLALHKLFDTFPSHRATDFPIRRWKK